ncbi:helix-turn-helix domain-containing protein [Acidithiobacillus sp. IBUN Pt1247-S3]|uniref:helix-turn-helix domain-containing protein n=1 Tax=Acidithiobacillus sp. IBUN Pt1247-S3 TaxID=3166642 RepID=UPI0034E4FE98
MNDIADRVKEIRTRLNLSQAKLGVHAGGVSKSAVHQWETGVTKPAWEALSALHKSLRINPDWVMRGEGSMFEEQASDGLPLGARELTPKQQALLGIFDRLTSSQQETIIRELEDIKRKNEEIVEELTRKTGATRNGS